MKEIRDSDLEIVVWWGLIGLVSGFTLMLAVLVGGTP